MADVGLDSLLALLLRQLGQSRLIGNAFPDPLIADLKALGIRNPFQPIPAEEQSASDRLRPPYLTPLPGGEPATAGAAINTEVGFKGLPPAYQQALLRLPQMRTLIGEIPDDPGLPFLGLNNKTRGAIVATSPNVMTHELVHEWQRRSPAQEQMSKRGEESLARYVGGQFQDDHVDQYPDTVTANQRVQQGQPPVEPLGLLHSLLRSILK